MRLPVRTSLCSLEESAGSHSRAGSSGHAACHHHSTASVYVTASKWPRRGTNLGWELI